LTATATAIAILYRKSVLLGSGKFSHSPNGTA
jgi:hypothetical protein